MKFYVIRHGQTNWNIEGKIQGNTDIELNETGIKQANAVKETIKKYDIDLIVSSPLKRARKTAEIINETVKCDIIFSENLKERCYGEFEGKIRKDISIDEIMQSEQLNNYYANIQYKGIETIQDLCDRVWNLIDNLKNEYKNKNILLVSHGGTIRAINAYFKGINEDGTVDNPGVKNCEIKEYKL